MHCSQRLRAHWSASFKMSRASSWAWGKCKDISADSFFPTHLAITKTAATTGKAFNIYFPCNLKTMFLNRVAYVRHCHMYRRPSKHIRPHLLKMYCQEILILSPHTHFFGHCVASEIEMCNLFPLENLGKDFPFWRKLVSGQSSPEKIRVGGTRR